MMDKITKEKDSPKKPEIFDYLDYRQFLTDHIEFLQKKNSKYSQRWIAKKAGFNSPHLLSMIISGKRKLSEENAKLLSFALELTEREEQYFQIIVLLAHTEDREKQESLIDEIKIKFNNGLFADFSDQGHEILQNWYMVAIREMTALKGFVNDPEWIAERLLIEPEQAKEALQVLIGKGYLKEENGQLVRSEPSIRANNYVMPLLMANFHLQALQKSFNALSLPRSKRYFEALTIALPKKVIPELQEKIIQCIREIDMCGENYPRRDELYQLNIQFFSLLTSKEDN